MNDLQTIWVYLSATPLLHLVLTLLAFQAGSYIFNRTGQNPVFNPVLLAVVALVALLKVTDTDFDSYFAGAQFVHFLLGPATVALAIPLYNQLARVKKSALPLFAAIICGSATAGLSAILVAMATGQPGQELLASIAPKSVTSPIAMGIAEKIGGLPSLTAVLVILTGIIGAAFGPTLLTLIDIKDPAARGTAFGTVTHGIGTARAMQESEVAGAFSGLAMGINGLITALILPVIWYWIF